jgi:hypothetical protein
MNKRMKILLIPDTQAKPGVPMEHFTWIGKYIVDKRPDVVVHIGDHWDMPSLSSYDKGKKCFEGRRYQADIAAGNHAMDLLMAPLAEYNKRQAETKHKQYKPRLVFCIGNHEQRIERAIEADAILEDTIGYHNFNLDKYGWEVHPYLAPININDVHFAHYFYNPMTGKPWGGMPETRLKNVGHSFVMGHQQGLKHANLYVSTGDVRRALIAGSCYLHDEDYKGPQANHHWRGIIMLHEVLDGDYDMMEVSLDYLKRRQTKVKE